MYIITFIIIFNYEKKTCENSILSDSQISDVKAKNYFK